MKKKLTNEQMNGQNYRYKKKTPPVDEFVSMNGPVKVRTIETVSKQLPTYKPGKPASNAFKCSKCQYVANDRIDFNEHWSLEH